MIPPALLGYITSQLSDDAAFIGEEMTRNFARLGNTVDILEGNYFNQRGVTPYEVIYRKNRFRVLHYQSDRPKRFKTPVVLVPSLIGAHYIFDIAQDKSFVSYLLKRGFDVYLVDWGRPSKVEGKNDIGDYIRKYLDRAIEKVRQVSGIEQINLFGYSLGALMSLIYSAVYPDKVKNLVLLTPPVDFEDDDSVLTRLVQPEYLNVQRIVDYYDHLIPASFLQAGSDVKNAVGNFNRSWALWQILWNQKALENHLAIDHWAHDSVPMASEFWKEYITRIYVKNQLMTNTYRMKGVAVDLKKITCPLLVVAGDRDDIVTPKSARGAMTVTASEDKTLMMKSGSHFGVLIGSLAKNEVWPDLFSWLSNRSDRLGRRTGKVTQY